MRTAEQVVNEIHSAISDGDKQGLRNTAALFEALQAWPRCPVIHIAGTNGKGSVCAMLSSVLSAAGYRVGLYTSPFLQTYRERIRINGVPLETEKLQRYGNETLDAAEKLKSTKGWRCTPFELGTALAFRAFSAEMTELIISETGMGGRLDATNTVPRPAVCGITAIGMDHMQHLGHTIDAIAGEKAGIIKPGVPVVCGPQEYPEAARVIAEAAEARKAPLILTNREQIHPVCQDRHGSNADYDIGKNGWHDLRISLPGDHQTENTLTVLAILEELKKQGIQVQDRAVRAGLAGVFWPGRLEWQGNLLMDGAHNEQGAAALRRFTEKHLEKEKTVLLCGVLKEKMTENLAEQLSWMAREAVTVTPDSPRAMRAEELKALLTQKGMNARAANNLKEGLEKARALAGEEGVILATGSLYFIGALRSELGLKP